MPNLVTPNFLVVFFLIARVKLLAIVKLLASTSGNRQEIEQLPLALASNFTLAMKKKTILITSSGITKTGSRNFFRPGMGFQLYLE